MKRKLIRFYHRHQYGVDLAAGLIFAGFWAAMIVA